MHNSNMILRTGGTGYAAAAEPFGAASRLSHCVSPSQRGGRRISRRQHVTGRSSGPRAASCVPAKCPSRPDHWQQPRRLRSHRGFLTIPVVQGKTSAAGNLVRRQNRSLHSLPDPEGGSAPAKGCEVIIPGHDRDCCHAPRGSAVTGAQVTTRRWRNLPRGNRPPVQPPPTRRCRSRRRPSAPGHGEVCETDSEIWPAPAPKA
ncbi:hypothetical protein B0T25DRAFT_496903 [Lasiosphaeria hispida]|uniref:Uncharacterized protein n=1 Tax=Lasiosphaeria hispida TaxID=260671 RepID=A0AAJ0MFE8_9PEZI|nr:hypothetical protein B0T25DRAFT_496903 [Lasiosphaeria hispida]